MSSLRQLSLLVGGVLSLGSLTAAFPVYNRTASTAPSTNAPSKYIITLKHGLTARDLESHVSWVNQVHKRSLDASNNSMSTGAGVHKTFGNLHVYVGEFDDDTLEQIKSRPDVEAVEEDQMWHPFDEAPSDPLHEISNPIYDAFFSSDKPNNQQPRDISQAEKSTTGNPQAIASQPSAPWGLARISHRSRGQSDYLYNPPAGSGTYAYVIDTGLNTAHADFGGRATFGYNAVSGSGSESDVQGHGTHTAGIIAAGTYGVAKSAELVAIKVFDQGGSLTSVILDGYNWAVADIKAKGRVGAAVINMSLGGGTSKAFNNAVEAAYQAGIVTVVAAGNEGRDVGSDSPASAGSALTVGAVDNGDRQASYSNYGRAVDIYAPGTGILSTWIGGPTATNTMSGTSMACPHVSGLVLYLMAKEGLRDPGAIVARVKGLGSEGVISGLGADSPNLLAYNGC
ncbi:Subtilase [Coniochaeta hoffmannii]|uniref:Subtilase n=1 Tax=Coniochaeta hoffmannii TaxID=91930 RepID=A0AA38VVZ5_9PEZI|nr:Subtilase [Coniochaeta hoffmannii]